MATSSFLEDFAFGSILSEPSSCGGTFTMSPRFQETNFGKWHPSYTRDLKLGKNCQNGVCPGSDIGIHDDAGASGTLGHRWVLLPNYAYTLFRVSLGRAGALCFIHHSDSVVVITQGRLTFVVRCEFFSGKDVVSGARAIGLEIGRR